MSTNHINFAGNTVFIGDKTVTLEYPVMSAFENKGRIFVLFDPDSFVESFGQFHNLIALDATGNKIWDAQLPTSTSGDRYYQLTSIEPLIADSIYSFTCTLDHESGRILNKEFYK